MGKDRDLMKLYELFQEFAGEHKLPVIEWRQSSEAPVHLCIQLLGENSTYEGHMLADDEENLFIFYTLLNVKVPKDRRERLSSFLLDLNYSLKIGGFYMDAESGELTARVCQFMAGADWEKKELMEILVSLCGRMADQYYPEIMKEIYG